MVSRELKHVNLNPNNHWDMQASLDNLLQLHSGAAPKGIMLRYAGFHRLFFGFISGLWIVMICKWFVQYFTGWWFGTFPLVPYIGKKNPNWLSYFSEGLWKIWNQGLKPPTRLSKTLKVILSHENTSTWSRALQPMIARRDGSQIPAIPGIESSGTFGHLYFNMSKIWRYCLDITPLNIYRFFPIKTSISRGISQLATFDDTRRYNITKPWFVAGYLRLALQNTFKFERSWCKTQHPAGPYL